MSNSATKMLNCIVGPAMRSRALPETMCQSRKKGIFNDHFSHCQPGGTFGRSLPIAEAIKGSRALIKTLKQGDLEEGLHIHD